MEKVIYNNSIITVTLYCGCEKSQKQFFSDNVKFVLKSASFSKQLYSYKTGELKHREIQVCTDCYYFPWFFVPNQEPGRENKVLKEMNSC